MLFTKEIYRLNVVLDFIPVFREAINIKKLGIFDVNLDKRSCCFCKQEQKLNKYLLTYEKIFDHDALNLYHSKYLCTEKCLNMILLQLNDKREDGVPNIFLKLLWN